jgi:DNA-binding transcriptional LysR family regulator
MAAPFNYRHLYYFWVVAKEGGMARAAARLGMAVQTVSAQVRALEQSLGHALFKPAGRGMALTDAGVAAMSQAEQIFQLGEQLPALVREAATGHGLRLAVGISDGLPKLVVRHLLQPALEAPNVRLLCHEDEFDRLLGDLALHRLDVVLSDRAAPPNPNRACTATRWARRRWPGSRRRRSARRTRPRFRLAWPACRCSCRPATPPCGHGWTNGSSARASVRTWPANSRTARCWPPSAAAAWARSRPRGGPTRNC